MTLYDQSCKGVCLHQVQEAAAASEGFLHIPDAQLNMGILSLALGKAKEAVQVLPPCWPVGTCMNASSAVHDACYQGSLPSLNVPLDGASSATHQPSAQGGPRSLQRP